MVKSHSENIVNFPFSKTRPASKEKVAYKGRSVKDLGLTDLSQALQNGTNSINKSPKGRWCSNCKGIWYTYFFEVQCPKCGNRKG